MTASWRDRLRARPFEATLILVAAATALRVAALFAAPLELYPDEAQYWLWSRHLAFGYFSKPPMIAWLIRATTAIGGDGEAWVRLSAPLLHAAAALALQRAGARLYDERTGFWAAAVYTLMPGVQLSSGVIATDAPLLLFSSLAFWAYATLWSARSPREARVAAAGFGLALGLACLSKYAGMYALGGALIHAASSRSARRGWSFGRVGLAAGLFALVIAPNLAWNVGHHFQTLAHTAANADLGSEGADGAHRRVEWLDPRGPLGFIAGQFGMFGPLPFAALAIGALVGAARRRLDPASGLALAFTLPALAIVLGEAAIARANANWAAQAYASGSVLAAAWLGRGAWRAWRGPGLALQALAGAAFTLAVVCPALADRAGFANNFKRARGWRETADIAHSELILRGRSAPVSALAVDDRFTFNALAYYGRAWLTPGSAPLRMWVHEARAKNQAEAESPLTARDGTRVVMVAGPYRRQAAWDFGRIEDPAEREARLDLRHARALHVFTGVGFAPRPRDRLTGLPTPP